MIEKGLLKMGKLMGYDGVGLLTRLPHVSEETSEPGDIRSGEI
jgi:hypothetical protein